MSRLFAILALVFVTFMTAPAMAQSANLTDDWHGYYVQGGQSVPFEVELVQIGGRIGGTMTEPNTFGSADALFLLASFEGSVAGAEVSFVKTYDGTGGQAHTVRYRGRLVSDRRIVGTWSIDNISDRFEMVR